jgi:hypothetical protein
MQAPATSLELQLALVIAQYDQKEFMIENSNVHKNGRTLFGRTLTTSRHNS